MAARPAAGRTQGFVHFFARSARHILVEEGTRSSFTLPSTSLFTSTCNLHSKVPQQQHFLDDPRKFATFLYIRSRFATSCSTFPKLLTTPTLAIRVQYIRHQMTPRPPARSHRRAASGKKPPPRSIGQEATAAQHRARSNRKMAPPRRIG